MEKKRFIFDLDGTLLVPDYSYEEKYFKSVLNKEEVKRFIPFLPDLVADYEKLHKRYDMKMLSEYLTKRSGINIDEDIIKGWCNALSETTPKLIDGVMEMLTSLKTKNKDLVVLTNWFSEPQITRLEKAGIKNYFTEFYGGNLVLKPHPESYITACGKWSPSECVMIGDSLDTDIYGAMKVGMDTIYYNPKNKDNFDKNKVKSIGNMKQIREMI